MGNIVLVIAAHPDDEVLGCGGTIAKHVLKGDEVHLLFMSDGVASRKKSDIYANQRRTKGKLTALKILGVASEKSLNFPDNRMDSVALLDVVQSIEPIIETLKPQIIYTHNQSDLNVDHQVTFSAVMTACRPLPGSSVLGVYGFEVISSTEWSTGSVKSFQPNLFIDITETMDTKLAALDAYSEEMREPPHSRSVEHIKALSHRRGLSAGMNAAEAFEVYRILA